MTFILWRTSKGNKVDFSAAFNFVSDFHLTWDGSGDGTGVNPGDVVFIEPTAFFARVRPQRGKVYFYEPAVFKIEPSGPGLSEPVQAEFREPTRFEVVGYEVWHGGIYDPRDPISDVVGSERDEVSEVVVP